MIASSPTRTSSIEWRFRTQFQVNDGYGDIVGTVKGEPVAAEEVVESSADRWEYELVNLLDLLPDGAEERYSYVFGGSAQVLDHVLVNVPLLSRPARPSRCQRCRRTRRGPGTR